MTTLWLAGVAAPLGLLYLVLEATGRSGAARRLKAVPILLLVAAVLLADPALSPLYQMLVAAGLILSALGDILLALPRERFIAGLLAFLGAHLCYIAAFWSASGSEVTWWLLALPAAAGAVVLALVLPHAERPLRAPVALYVTVIVAMAWRAGEFRLGVGGASGLLAFGGAILFLISDGVLALNKFRARMRGGSLIVMTSYYLAQGLIALSVQQWGK